MVRDADPTSLPSSADNNTTKWVASTDGSASSNKPTRGAGLPTALERVRRYEFDAQGRSDLSATEDGTNGNILFKYYTVFEPDRILKFPFWDDQTSRPLLPIEVTEYDEGGRAIEEYAVDPARTAASAGRPTGLSSGTDQSHYVRWTRFEHDELTGGLTKTHRYHDIPSSGYGSKDTNYAETLLGYDAVGRRVREVSPGGTVTRSVFDNLGRLESAWVGTDDVPSSGDWSPTNNSGANMTKVAQYEFDGGSGGQNSQAGKGDITDIDELGESKRGRSGY